MGINKKSWEPTNYQKDRLISSIKKYTTQKISYLQRELKCPNEFIFDFIK